MGDPAGLVRDRAGPEVMPDVLRAAERVLREVERDLYRRLLAEWRRMAGHG